jgi:DnaK suppressor protein
MDATTLQKYETMLLELQAELRTELDGTIADSKPVALDGSMGRISRGDAMQTQQLALEMKRRREERLQRIQASLQRISQGTYGRCGRCRKPISTERLDTFPDAVLCVRCAS